MMATPSGAGSATPASRDTTALAWNHAMDKSAADSPLTRLPALSRARVLVIGDAMLDRYVYGRVERISPEAPIPVLLVERETAMLGGAGNVARNVAALGAASCLVTVAGNDRAGHEIAALMGAEKAIAAQLVVETGRLSTVKSRFVGGTQQLLRADQESVAPLSEPARADALSRVDLSLGGCDIVVLSDYGKGLLAGGFAKEIIDRSRQ